MLASRQRLTRLFRLIGSSPTCQSSIPSMIGQCRGISQTAACQSVLKRPQQWASNYVRRLNAMERLELFAALRFEAERSHQPDVDNSIAEVTAAAENATKGSSIDTAPPTRDQLRQVVTLSAIPFVGFGFFDNAIMIMAGEYIDVTLGATLCISTLAAAAIGNWISDLAGLSLAGWVESMTSRLGFETPRLTPEQLDLRSTRWATVIGRSLGISLGCFLGMLPLLFFDDDEDEEQNEEDQLTEKGRKK